MNSRTVPVSITCLLVLYGCGQRTLPDLPGVDTSRFETDVRNALDHAYAEAKANASDVDRVLRLGMVLHAHEQFQAAGQCYARAHALDPNNFAALYYWGSALASSGAHGRSAERLRAALAIRPDPVPARLKLADVLRESGDAKQSAELYKQILSNDPDNARAHFGLGRALSGDEATEEFRKALTLFPRYGAAQFALAAAYRRQGDEAKAEEILRHYERDKTLLPPLADPEMTALRELNVSRGALLQRAGEQEAEGRLEAAASLYERTHAHANLISIYARLHRDSDAEKAYRDAIERNPSEFEAHYNFGVFCFERGRRSEARAAFHRVIQLQPKHAEALNNLGAILEQEGKWEQAAALYRRAVAAKPAYPLAHFHLGRIYANQAKYALAIEEFERSLQPATESTPAYLYALAAAHARAGNRVRAADLMRSARTQASARGQGQLVASIDRDLAVLDRKQ